MLPSTPVGYTFGGSTPSDSFSKHRAPRPESPCPVSQEKPLTDRGIVPDILLNNAGLARGSATVLHREGA